MSNKADVKDEIAPVILTKRAIAQIKKAITRERQSKDAGLRILLVHAGNGFRYDLQFEEKIQPSDYISNQGGVRVHIDRLAAQYLQGYQLDFFEAEHGAGFIFQEPSGEKKSDS